MWRRRKRKRMRGRKRKLVAVLLTLLLNSESGGEENDVKFGDRAKSVTSFWAA